MWKAIKNSKSQSELEDYLNSECASLWHTNTVAEEESLPRAKGTAMWTLHCDHPYDNKLDYSDEMEKFLKRHELPKPSKKEIENLNKTKRNTKTELRIRNFSTKKHLGSWPQWWILSNIQRP